MNRISAYQTTDARIHQSRQVARRHQAWIDLRLALRQAVSEVLDCKDPTERDAVLAAFLVECRDDIRELLRLAERAP